jgi:hypothetical protein
MPWMIASGHSARGQRLSLFALAHRAGLSLPRPVGGGMARERPRLDSGPAKRRAPIGPLCPESGQTGRRLASPLRANSGFEQSQQKLSVQANRLAEDKNPLLPLTKKVLEFCGYSGEVPTRSRRETFRVFDTPSRSYAMSHLHSWAPSKPRATRPWPAIPAHWHELSSFG